MMKHGRHRGFEHHWEGPSYKQPYQFVLEFGRGHKNDGESLSGMIGSTVASRERLNLPPGTRRT